MDKRAGLGFAIFVVLCLLLVVVVFVVIFLHGRDEVKPAELNLSANVTLFNISIGSSAVDAVRYELRNESTILVSGSLFSDKVEEFRDGLPANRSVWLKVWGDSYYVNESECNVTIEDKLCFVDVKRKALNYSVELSDSLLTIDAHGDGFVQANITLCFIERSNVINVVVPLNVSVKPLDWWKSVDFCYVVEHDVSGMFSVPVEVRKNPFNNVTDLLQVWVRDSEVGGLKGAGLRVAGVLV